MSDEPSIRIDENGIVHATEPILKRRLAARAGVWRIVPSTPELLVLQRADEYVGSRFERRRAAGGTDPGSEDPNADPTFPGAADSGAHRPVSRAVLLGEIDHEGAVVDIVNFITSSQWSGALSVVSGTARKTIYFAKGDIYNASSNLSVDRLGSILFRFGVITKEQLEEAQGAVSHEQRLGHVLVQMGALSTDELVAYVKKQIEEILFSVLLMPDGSYYFYKQSDGARNNSTLQLETKMLLMEGVRRIDEMVYFRKKIPSSAAIFNRTTPAPSAVNDLEGSQAMAYAAVDGARDVAAIARETRLGEFEATKAIFGLLQQGAIKAAAATDSRTFHLARAPKPLVQIIDNFNYVFARVYAAVAAFQKEETLERAVTSFVRGKTDYAPLFTGIDSTVGGMLSGERLLGNLARVYGGQEDHTAVDAATQGDYLRHALNELLFHEMFALGEAMDKRGDRALRERLNQILSESRL
jgi:hypothetical protein